MSKFTRREFLKTGGLALAGLTIAPSSILGKSHGHVPPSDRLNIADKNAAYKKMNELKKDEAFKNAWLLSSK